MELVLDEPSVSEGLEIALRSMNSKEKAQFEVRSDYAYSQRGSKELGVGPEEHIDYTIELLDFKNGTPLLRGT